MSKKYGEVTWQLVFTEFNYPVIVKETSCKKLRMEFFPEWTYAEDDFGEWTLRYKFDEGLKGVMYGWVQFLSDHPSDNIDLGHNDITHTLGLSPKDCKWCIEDGLDDEWDHIDQCVGSLIEMVKDEAISCIDKALEYGAKGKLEHPTTAHPVYPGGAYPPTIDG